MEAVSAGISQIVYEIGLEVDRAKKMWGEEFDRKNSLDNWIAYVTKYLGKAAAMEATVEEQEANLRKAAGLLVSAIDMLKREGFAPRHYEGQSQPKSLPEIDYLESGMASIAMFQD